MAEVSPMARTLALACGAWSIALLSWGVFWGAWVALDEHSFAGRIADPPAVVQPHEAGATVVVALLSGLLVLALRVLFGAVAIVRILSALILARAAGRAWAGRPFSRAWLGTWATLTILFEGAILLATRGQETVACLDLGLAVVLMTALIAGTFRPVASEGVPDVDVPKAKMKSLALLDDAV